MFFSIQLLVRRDARFGLVWRAATSGTTRGLSRRAIVGMSIPNMCHEILNFTPTDKSREADLTSKFSLYVLAQLVYGTAIIFGRQTTLFEQDARAAYESCKRITMDEMLLQCSRLDEEAAETTKRIQRRSKKLAVNVDIDEEPEERFLNVARRSDITMVESEVAVWQPRDIFFDVEHNQPIDFSKEGFIDWNEERASQGSKDSIEKAVDQRSKALEPLPLEEELPPFPPQEAFANMTRDAFMAGSFPVENPSNNAEPQLPNQPQIQEDTITSSLELRPVSGSQLEVRMQRKRKHVPIRDSQEFTISYETIKKLQLDYSSLIKSVEELRLERTIDSSPKLHDLLAPYPAYAASLGFRFPNECIELYRSRFCDTLTYAQALKEGPFYEADRGPKSKLWRYRSSDSSLESDAYELFPGITFLKGTPERFRNCVSAAKKRRIDEDEELLLTPGKATLTLTPERYRTGINESQINGMSALYNEMLPPIDTLQMAGDVPAVFQRINIRIQYSMIRSFIEGRPSFVQLHNPVLNGDMSQLSSHSAIERSALLSPTTKKMLNTEECRDLMKLLCNSSDFITLSSIIPPAITSKKRAAAVFSAVLSLLRQNVIVAQQDEPYGEIWIKPYASSRYSSGESAAVSSGPIHT
ncbi:hypothetical protein Q1695_012022 [Nippostrongylus brasiliensis]|nr:hypothetical protein Q1695_012022 [Nippostrongylus brasiliensis]